jgi:hypothetical protein
MRKQVEICRSNIIMDKSNLKSVKSVKGANVRKYPSHFSTFSLLRYYASDALFPTMPPAVHLSTSTAPSGMILKKSELPSAHEPLLK